MTTPSEPAQLVDRQVLQAERDVARADRRVLQADRRTEDAEEQVLATTEQLRRERERALGLQQALDQVFASTSWRISRPVRVTAHLLKALRPAAVAPVAPPAPDLTPPPDDVPLLPQREQAILQRLQTRRRG